MTPEEAARLLQDDTKIAIALASGAKPEGQLKERLPLSVRKELQRIAAGVHHVNDKEPNIAPSIVALAQALGLTRQMVHRYQKRPGAPKARPNGGHNIADWKAFIGRTDIEDEGEAKPAKLSVDKQATVDIQTRKMRDMDFNFGVRSRDYITTDEANSSIDAANLVVKREIIKAMEHELPPMLEGLSAVEIQLMIRNRLNEIWRLLPKRIKKTLDVEE